MAAPPPTERRDPTRDASLRRRFLILAGIVAVLALLHFVDHVVRGALVIDLGLDPQWDHSGWPFATGSDKPYIMPLSFVLVFGLLLGGILGTLRGRLWAGYWLGVSIALTALLAYVHFFGFSPGSAETPSVIAMTHQGTVAGVLALIDLFGLFAVLAALGFHSVITRQHSGHW